MVSREFSLADEQIESYIALFGLNDRNVSLIEESLGVRIAFRDNQLKISGEEADAEIAFTTVCQLLESARRNGIIDRSAIRYVISMIREGKTDLIEEEAASVIATTHRGKQIRAKSIGQKQYVDSILKKPLTFASGPAGTGKTYLAMAFAVISLKRKEIERIILTRPAVEAGEKLGFLPGDMAQKVDPYLRPLYDAMYDFLGPDSCVRLMEKGTIEVAPLAYMRGRTLSDAFIILDEAQNTTPEQMKMFLTRMGYGSKVVVTGDITQTDLPQGKKSGLTEAVAILKDIPEIGIIRLTDLDIVRNDLVQKIVKAYEFHTVHPSPCFHSEKDGESN